MTTVGEWLQQTAAPRTVSVDSLPSASSRQGAYTRAAWWDGEKFPGGYGATNVLSPDYWMLRQRSVELFETNPYARGLVRRLVTNEINTGLEPACTPEEGIIGVPEGSMEAWTDKVENRFYVWSRMPRVCDWSELSRFGAIQAKQRQAALVSGDVLCVIRHDRRTGLPRVQLVDGRLVQTPMDRPRGDNRIVHGVEMDSRGRQVAFWIVQEDRTHQRLPAYGARSGRLQAWLVYGTDHRLDEVRGRPLLSLFLQMLKEVDRYRDAALRKAVINSMLAMFIQKDVDKLSSLSISGGATRTGTDTTVDESGTERTFSMSELIPGLVIEELNPGETPQPFGAQGTDEKFGDFEEAMLRVYAWANEIPPEILLLSFTNNYSASQAAINEFKIYLNRIRTDIGQGFCAPIYREWLLSEALNGTIAAPGLVDAFRQRQWDKWGAWTSSEWWGHIKPSTDIVKQAKGHEILIAHGWSNNDLVARELTGTKFAKNVKKLRTENELLVEANTPLQPVIENRGADNNADPNKDNQRDQQKGA